MTTSRELVAVQYIASPHPQNAGVWVIYDAETLMRIDSVNADSGMQAVSAYVDMLERVR